MVYLTNLEEVLKKEFTDFDFKVIGDKKSLIVIFSINSKLISLTFFNSDKTNYIITEVNKEINNFFDTLDIKKKFNYKIQLSNKKFLVGRQSTWSRPNTVFYKLQKIKLKQSLKDINIVLIPIENYAFKIPAEQFFAIMNDQYLKKKQIKKYENDREQRFYKEVKKAKEILKIYFPIYDAISQIEHYISIGILNEHTKLKLKEILNNLINIQNEKNPFK